MSFTEIIKGVQELSAEQLEEVRLVIDKELSEKRIQEIEIALKEAKKAASAKFSRSISIIRDTR